MNRQPMFSGEEAAVMAVIEAESSAYFSKDFDAYARCFVQAPYIRRIGWWTRDGVADRTGWDQFHNHARLQMEGYPAPNASPSQLRRENVTIRVGGDMAWVTFDQFAPEAGEPDIDMPGLSRETRVLEKHDGKWLIAYQGYVHVTGERTDTGAFRVDAAGSVNWMNKAAQAAAQAADYVAVRHGRLRAVMTASHRKLEQAIAVAAGVSRDRLENGRPAIPVVLDSASGDEPLVCWVVSEGSGSGNAIVSINDVRFAHDRLDAAAALYGFSPTQRKVIEHIIAGNDLARCARFMGVSVNTVRTHLQRIFDKTGARSQPALTRKLLGIGALAE